MAKTVTIPTGVKYKDNDGSGDWSAGDELYDSGVRGPQFFAVNGVSAKPMAGKQETIQDDTLAAAIGAYYNITPGTPPAVPPKGP